MKRLLICSAAAATAALLLLLPASALRAQDSLDGLVRQYIAGHPDEVGAMVRDYVAKHPDLFRDVLTDALKQQPAISPAPGAVANAPPLAMVDPSVAIRKDADSLFKSKHQVTLGNPDGDVTLVEFFDYNCGFCKGALPAMLSLIGDDPKLRIVLKEWPILGPGSIEAAHVAVAVRMQDPGGEKYLAFHRKLLGDPGLADNSKALGAAAAAGLDMARLQRDMDSDEVATTLSEDSTLAADLGITGTPGYVIGNTVVPGAIGLAALQDQIATARSHVN